jgi:thymidine phosphorylase
MVTALGGPVDLVERSAHYLPAAPITRVVVAKTDGYVTSIATRDLGLAVIGLGGGRTRPQDDVDPRVGMTGLPRIGAKIEQGQPLAIVHAADAASADRAEATLLAAYRIDTVPLRPTPAILERIAD